METEPAVLHPVLPRPGEAVITTARASLSVPELQQGLIHAGTLDAGGFYSSQTPTP